MIVLLGKRIASRSIVRRVRNYSLWKNFYDETIFVIVSQVCVKGGFPTDGWSPLGHATRIAEDMSFPTDGWSPF